MEILKVSSHSSPNSVAGAIAGVIREQKAVEVQAVGVAVVKVLIGGITDENQCIAEEHALSFGL